MKVKVERSGGFANIRASASGDTEALSPPAAEEIKALAKELRKKMTEQKDAGTPDAFQYRITIEDDDGTSVSGTVGESDGAAELFGRLLDPSS